MKEKIGEVILNYEFYKESDTCMESGQEDTLLEMVQNTDNLEEKLTHENEWMMLYNFSPIRRNILEWYEFEKDASLLEIGAGCGALTGLFCEKVNHVTAIDFSKKKSIINATRNQSFSNLEIYVGNLSNIKLEQKFDYITLIDVLAFSGYYVNSENPFTDMLKLVKQMLKPGGKIIVAIENKYGMKYWAGAREDHTGEYFKGICGYHGVDKVQTFSKKGLKQILENAGFEEYKFYYPLPDFKMPLEIYSEEYLPKAGAIKNASPAYDSERMEIFNEVLAFDSVCEDGLFEEFANSFIVISE